MASIREYWPVYLFVLTVVFSLGRYEFMLKSVKDKIKILFGKNEKQEEKINHHETEIEVTKEKLSNIENSVNENKELSMAILNELRGNGGRTRRSDQKENP